MYRTLVLAASIAALSVPAFAGDVTISLAGKTKAEVVAEIQHAAAAVCAQQGYVLMYERMSCVSQVEHDALSQMASVQKSGKSS